MEQPETVLDSKWILGIVLLSLLCFDQGHASCTFRETQGYTFKRIPQEYIMTRDGSIRELQFAVKAPASAHVRVTASDSDDSSTHEHVYFITRYTYELNIDYQNHMSFEHVGVMGPVAQQQKKVLSSREFRPFWLRFNITSGQLSFGHIGQNDSLISWTDTGYTPRKFAVFSVANLRSTHMDAVWVFCDNWTISENPDEVSTGLDCQSITSTKDGSPSDYFRAEDEFVYRAGHWWFKFAINLPKNASYATVQFLDSTENNLFQIVFTENKVTLVMPPNGKELLMSEQSCNVTSGNLQPVRIQVENTGTITYDCYTASHGFGPVPMSASLNASFVRFVSNTSAKVNWLHRCKGFQRQSQLPSRTNYDDAVKQTMNQLYNSVFKSALISPATFSSAEEAVQNVQRSCRVVQTFKPAYDQYFEMREGGAINGSFSRLVFTAWGSNFRIKLSEEFPVTENFYEILLGIGNSTTISRSGDSAAAYVDTDALWKNNTLHQFIIEHDAATGDINIINRHEIVLTWKDTKAFPIRFFSVSSGFTGRLSNTTWIFGCEKRQPQCYHPVHANQYLYSQYFWLSRESTFSPETNSTTLEIWMRAKNSAHLRFEPVLPYSGNPSATVEFDFGVEDRINLDIQSRRVASQKVLNAVNENTFTGYWIKQRMGTGSIELGKIGEAKALLRYAHARLRPLLYFSGTNSQRAGNSTWIFGCAGGERPGADSAMPGEDYSSETTDSDDISFEREEDSSEESTPKLEVQVKIHTTGSSPSTARVKTLTTSAPYFRDTSTLRQWLKALGPPTGNTSIRAHLEITRVALDEEKAGIALHGLLQLVWRENVTWPTSSLPANVDVSTESHLGWVSRDLVASEGTLTINKKAGGVMTRRWNGTAVLTIHSVKIEPSCVANVASWPKESRKCSFAVALWAHHERMVLEDFSVQVDTTASTEDGWEKPDITETNTITTRRHGMLNLPSKKIHVFMKRDGGPLYGLYVTPLIITAIVILICGWVRTLIGSRVVRTLKERLIVLCCTAFVLGGIAISIHGRLPKYYTSLPTLLWAYIWSSGIVASFLVLSLVIGSRISSGSPPPSWLVQLFSGKITSHILCLACSSVYLSTTAAEGEPCETPTTREQQVSWFWSWQLVITALDRLITTACFGAMVMVISVVL